MRFDKRGQGATEYLLMLAAVLVIVAIAVYYVTSTGPTAIITGTAIKSNDNVNFTPSSTMVPTTIISTDWKYAIYRGAQEIYPVSGWADGPGNLTRGIPIALTATGCLTGDVLKIQYQGKNVFDAANVS